MMLPPLQARFVLAALAVFVLAGIADWALLTPENPFEAFLDVAIAGGSATAVLLPLLVWLPLPTLVAALKADQRQDRNIRGCQIPSRRLRAQRISERIRLTRHLMLWTHTGETLMYVGVGMLIGVIIAGIAQQMQGPP
jgi:hypothetical protein